MLLLSSFCTSYKLYLTQFPVVINPGTASYCTLPRPRPRPALGHWSAVCRNPRSNDTVEQPGAAPATHNTRAANDPSVFTITEEAHTRAFSWLKVATTAFTFKTLLRHYAKRALTPRSLNVKLGPRHNYHEGQAAIRHYANQR